MSAYCVAGKLLVIFVGSSVIKSAYRIDANWKVIALVVLLLPLLLKLGFWQLDRADEKVDLIARMNEAHLRTVWARCSDQAR